MASHSDDPKKQRKKILRVLFISLLLDLVSDPPPQHQKSWTPN